jgi:multidrug resistance efflux pump/beta-lactamase regulating signal transducer with metallopeptidase domain
MVAVSLMQSPWWLTAGWMMVHVLWIGCVIGLFAAAGHWLLSSRPDHRYLFAVACFAAVSCTPGLILICWHPEFPAESRSSRPLDQPASSAESRALALPISVLPAADPAPVEPVISLLDSVIRCLPWLWLIGTPATFVVLAIGLIGSERLRRQSEALNQAELANRCRRLAESLGVHCHVALGVCGRLAAPILVGIFKPMILLPPAALCGWTVEQLEMVLLHELAHVRRWDNLVNLLQRIVEAILFFHPVVWWLSAWIRLEREMCCDRVVVARTGNPRAYAETLASLALPESITRTGALAMAENRLVMRIRRILNLEDRSMCVSTKSFVFTSALLVAALIGVGLYANSDKAGLASEEVEDQEPVRAVEKQLIQPRKVIDEKKSADDPLSAVAKQVKTPARPDGAKDDAKESAPFTQRAAVEAYQTVQLYSRVSGMVKSVSWDDGDRVKRGQVLAELDAPDVELELKQKRALVEQAKAEINQAKSSIRAAQAVFEAAKALVLEAEAGVQGAKANQEARQQQLKRVKGMWDAKTIDASVWEEARVKLDAAQSGVAASEARWQAAKATAEEAKAKIVRAEADVQVAMAHVAVAEADLQRTRALLDSATIRSPFDGHIVSRTAAMGTFSQAAGQINAVPLVTVARTDLLRIVFRVPESMLAKIPIGTPAIIRIHAVPNKRYEGKVSRLAGAVDRRPGSVRVEIDLANPELMLVPGLSGTVTLKLEN